MIGILSFWADLPYSLLSDPFMVFKLPVSRSWSVGTWRSAFLSRVPCWFETIPRMQSVAQCPGLSRDDGCGIFDKGLSQAQIATLQATLDSLEVFEDGRIRWHRDGGDEVSKVRYDKERASHPRLYCTFA